MTFEQLKKYAKQHNCSVRWIECRNANVALPSRVALHVVCHTNGRSTNFYGIAKKHPRHAMNWINANS